MAQSSPLLLVCVPGDRALSLLFSHLNMIASGCTITTCCLAFNLPHGVFSDSWERGLNSISPFILPTSWTHAWTQCMPYTTLSQPFTSSSTQTTPKPYNYPFLAALWTLRYCAAHCTEAHLVAAMGITTWLYPLCPTPQCGLISMIGMILSSGWSQHLSQAMVKSHAMGLMLMGHMQSMPCQVWAARDEHWHEHKYWWVIAPHTCYGGVTCDGARAHGVHLQHAGGCCVGHGQDDEGL